MDTSVKRIALLLDKSASYDRGLIQGIASLLNYSPNWELFLEAPNYTAFDEKKQLSKKVLKWNPDFIVMNDSRLITDFRTLQIPIFISPSIKIVHGAINILADDHKIGVMGAKYFIDKGYKNFAFYGTDKIFWSEKRKLAFRQTIVDLKLNYFEIQADLNENWQNNPENISKLLEQFPKPIAIMACSDEFGIHILESSQIAGIKVPQEIAVLGVDNDEFICNICYPPMSSIDQNPQMIGLEIAKLISLIANERSTIPTEIIGSTFKVITRLSSDVTAIEDPEIKKALFYIFEKTRYQKINVDDVVASTFLSRRLLEIRFRKYLNRSILDEINRIRVETICIQLSSSKTPISVISDSFGFDSPNSFSSYFRKYKMMTPIEYRKMYL